MHKALLGAVALSLATLPAAGGREPGTRAKEQDVAELMKRKLDRSQKILEGIAVNDFDKIEKNAEELIRISKAAGWHVVKTPRYVMFSNEFQRAAEDLVKHSRAKNLDAAALSYVDLTLTCVRCHKYVREVRMTRLEQPERPEAE